MATPYIENTNPTLYEGLYQLFDLAVQNFHPLYRDRLQPVLEQTGMNKAGVLFLGHMNAQRGDKPLNPEYFVGRSPYTNAYLLWEKRFQDMIENGVVVKTDSGYELTPQTIENYALVNTTFYTLLGDIAESLQTDLKKLAILLKQVTDACLNAPNPPGTKLLQAVKSGTSGVAYNLLAEIDHYYDLLNAFRDDCHIAAWQPHQIMGYVWEALTFLWREEVNSLKTLTEKLQFRGYNDTDYANALKELVERGWLAQDDETYNLTPLGKQIRDEAEHLTDRYFYTPWATLTEADVNTLRDLLSQFKDELVMLVEAKQ